MTLLLASAAKGIQLSTLDWSIIGVFFVIVIGIGWAASRTAGKNTSEFFLGGRGMPWWLLGISMVACTFSCDTPNLVTDFVRSNGVAKNWAWWSFLITGMVTVFIYAKLWRRSRVMTDLEFYELRYSGKAAAFLRGFRSLYLGIFFNCLIMGAVTLAAIKIGQVIFDLDPLPVVIIASVGVVAYATLGGIKGVIWADFFQYSIAMFGAVYAAYVAVNLPEVLEIGGLAGLVNTETSPIKDKLAIFPLFDNWLSLVPILIVPIIVQWWSVWYPGAEPGGGGYIAQRMLAAKDEKNAIGATMLFNFMHYAMRPWPWIIVALASLVVYPDLVKIKAEFPGIDPTYLKEDIAYPVMISKLGSGWLGLVVASLIAAYMSTIGTHLNWGSSYVVNDFYKRFVKPDATEKQMVRMGRLCTVLLMVVAGTFALTFMNSAGQAFDILLLSGAGTGLIYLLRWFWWRINAWTEIAAIVVATVVAFWLVLGVQSEGTLGWYIGWDTVADKVYAIEDEVLAKSMVAKVDAAGDQTKILEKTQRDKVELWRKARKENVATRDLARLDYNDAQVALVNHQGALAPKALLLSLTNGKITMIAKEGKAEEMVALQAKLATADLQIKTTRATYKAALEVAVKEKKEDIDDAIRQEYITAIATQASAKRALDMFEGNHAIATLVGDVKADWASGLNKFLGEQGSGVKALIVGSTVYVYHNDVAGLTFSVQLIVCVLLVTLTWIITTLVTKPTSTETLRNFYVHCYPGGPGWRKVVKEAIADGIEIDKKNLTGSDWQMPIQILCVFFGCVAIYCALFSVGSFVYGNMITGTVLGLISAVSMGILFVSFSKLGAESEEDQEASSASE